MSFIASKVVMVCLDSCAAAKSQKVLKGHMAQYAPTDPHYEETVDERTGKVKRTKVGSTYLFQLRS